jgi:hypothetical protein
MSKSFILFVAFIIFSECILAQVSNYPEKKLEAVCIVGSSVGTSYEERTEEIAVFLESNNVKVHRFYDGNNNWDRIKKAAENCTFFIYSGHGTTAGMDGGFGGMVIENFISASTIKEELVFKNQPLVIYLNACGSAGSSADDVGDIGSLEAQKRIVGTATPFILIGAKGFYANNYFGGAKMFVNNMLDNMNINEAFLKNIYSLKVIKNEPIKDKRISSIYNIAFTTDRVYDKTKKKYRGYDIAYVGIPTYRLNVSQILSKK